MSFWALGSPFLSESSLFHFGPPAKELGFDFRTQSVSFLLDHVGSLVLFKRQM